ncbi:MAG TPA: hypothetical protein VEJ36_03720 [Nitrososphaerales archaeon]|nr:hypothetical protein [Nitrososphaerales archaeon]
MSQRELVLNSGLVQFETLEDIRGYVGRLLKLYESEVDSYTDKLGTLMREKEAKDRANRKKIVERNWQKVGFIYVNSIDPVLGTLELMLEALEDYKAKVLRTREMLKDFDRLAELDVPRGAILTLYLRNGVPLRIVVDTTKVPVIQAGQMVPAQQAA